MTDIMLLLSVVVVLSLNGLTVGIDDRSVNTKRILLNDQNVAGQVTRDIQSLTQLVNTMKNEMDTQKAKLASQEAEIASQKIEIATQKAEYAKLTSTTSSTGSTYIHWGRRGCSAPNTQLVYTGFAAGQHYYQYSKRFGGPANMLCLPDDSDLSNITTPGSSFLWGTEFEENVLKSDAANEDVPCAVCKSVGTSVSIMIPGKQSCYGGWKREYYGLIASGHYGEAASSFMCIDRHPDYVPGGQANDNGRLLYFTSIKCGALSCPPYKDGKAVNCVVCSQ